MLVVGALLPHSLRDCSREPCKAGYGRRLPLGTLAAKPPMINRTGFAHDCDRETNRIVNVGQLRKLAIPDPDGCSSAKRGARVLSGGQLLKLAEMFASGDLELTLSTRSSHLPPIVRTIYIE